MKEMPSPPEAACRCLGPADLDEFGCLCTDAERACRAWARDGLVPPMTEEQRGWAVAEIRSMGDVVQQPESFDGWSDAALADAVLCAWLDYAEEMARRR